LPLVSLSLDVIIYAQARTNNNTVDGGILFVSSADKRTGTLPLLVSRVCSRAAGSIHPSNSRYQPNT
jgi:hypothetical protein